MSNDYGSKFFMFFKALGLSSMVLLIGFFAIGSIYFLFTAN